tara:strand:- start:95 stop:484 length:390 start_codon:yes stop_codon:yes gene_type:complete
MIKHTIKDNLIYISISKKDFSYRIPIKKIGNVIDWRIGKNGTKGIVIKNVSTWTLRLFTKKITEEKYIQQFKNLVQEHASNNNINWEDTLLAVNIQNEFNWLITNNNLFKKKGEENDIISNLIKKYKLD